MELGKQIRKYRKELEFSQEDLAEKVFVSRQTISNWENDKSYPDVKSLVLISSIFNVSLDVLIKGDLKEMKEKIKEEDIQKFKNESSIFTVLMIIMFITPIPLLKFLGIMGIITWGIIVIITMWYAVKIEKKKKEFSIQTYKEIIAFSEGRELDEVQKNIEYGKSKYQKVLLGISAAMVAILVSMIMMCILK